MIKNKSGEKFGAGLLVVLLAVSVSLFSFITEENKITGFAALEPAQQNAVKTSGLHNLRDFRDINSLASMAAGNYYIDENGIVYWADDESMPAIGQLNNFDEILKNRSIYIDSDGRVGYPLSGISQNEKPK